MWPIKTTVFFFGFIAACALSLVYPIIGIVNYMMVYMLNPDKMWWGKPLDSFGLRYSMMAGVCLILGMIINAKRLPRTRGMFSGWTILLILFVAIALASGLIGYGYSNYSMNILDKQVKVTIFLLCLLKLATTRRNFTIVIWTLVIGTMLIGYDAYSAPADDFFAGRLNFVGGPDFRDSSGLAAHMAAMLPLAGAAFLATPSWRWRAMAAISGALAVNTIIQCRTRSAFIGLAAGLAVALIMAPRGRKGRIYVALSIGMIGAFSLTDGHFWNRMSTVAQPAEYSTDDTIESRFELWTVAGMMFADHPLGVGVGKFRDKIGSYRTPGLEHAFSVPKRVTHNSFLLCATELGVQGLLVLLAIIATSLVAIWRTARMAKFCEQPQQLRILAYGCLLSLVIYVTAATFTDRLYTESYWWVLALPICLETAVWREVVARDLTPELAVESEIDVFDGLPATARDARCALG